MKKLIFLFTICAFCHHSPGQQAPEIQDGSITTAEGVNLYYIKMGTGNETVIIPSGMYLSEEFSRLLNDNRMLIFYDQRGRGKSSKISEKKKLGIEYEISDLESIRNHFNRDKVSLMGWSYSGAVVALYSIKYPNHVNRVIQIGPIPPKKDLYWKQFVLNRSLRIDERDQKQIENLFERFQDTDKTDEFIKEYYRIAHQPLFYGCVIENKFRKDFYSLENERPDHVWKFVLPTIIESLGHWDFRSQLFKVRIPVLIIHGSYDAIPVASAKEWCRYLPQGKILIVKQAGHFPWLEKPELFYKAVDTFLAGDWPANAVNTNK